MTEQLIVPGLTLYRTKLSVGTGIKSSRMTLVFFREAAATDASDTQVYFCLTIHPDESFYPTLITP